MRSVFYYYTAVFTILSVNLFAQDNLSIVKNGFEIKLDFVEPVYRDKQSETVTIRDYYTFTDVSQTGKFKLPSQTFLVVIPPNSKPEIKITDQQIETIQAIIPSLQPGIKSVNDSILVSENIEYSNAIVEQKKSSPFEIIGYGWYRDYYYVQIKIYTHLFDIFSNQINRFKTLKLNVLLGDSHPGSIEKNNNSSTDVNRDIFKKAFINYEIADQFRGVHKYSSNDELGDWINYSAEYLKIGTASNGLFNITKTDLDLQGISTSLIDPKTFRLFESGKEIPITVFGEDDNIFDDSDYIQFYGTLNYSDSAYRVINTSIEEYHEYLNRYSDTTIYFLTWGFGNGLRIPAQVSFTTGLIDSVLYYNYFEHIENNNVLFFADVNEIRNQTSNWLNNKTWYYNQSEWLYGNTSRNYNFNVTDAVPEKDARFYFKAVSGGSDIVQDAHQVILKVNNVLLDSQSINRNDQVILNGTLNTNFFHANPNTLTVKNYQNGTTVNFLAVDWYDIEYPRTLKLDGNILLFTLGEDITSGHKVVRIENAGASEYEIYKITPFFKRIENYQLISNQLVFTDTVNAGDKYIVQVTSSTKKPVFYYTKQFANLRTISLQVDYIAITHQDFWEGSQNYVDEISSLYNLTTNLFLAHDIYDEFGYGYPTPESIKSFIIDTYNRRAEPKPAYLTLLGDANYDYKYYRDPSAGLNYVPSFGNPVGDNWYAIWDLNGLPVPQLKVGRIPFNNPDELEYYLSKIENNESLLFDEWNKRYLLFSGGITDGELSFLKSTNETLINRLISPRPISGRYTHFYKTISPRSDFGPYSPEEIENAISKGGVFISYIGHSGTATWDNSINKTSQLFNDLNRNPLITDFGCSTNKFAEPDIICFGERFLFNPDGQALAYIGNSSLGFTSTVTKVPVYFYENLLSDSLSEIGNAHLFSKMELINLYGNSEVNRVYSLSNIILGDPAVRIKIPKLPNFKLSSFDVILEDKLITDNLDSTKVKIAINNFGLATTEMLDINIVHVFNSTELQNQLLSVPVPVYSDTLSLWISSKNKPGIHNIYINIDPSNLIEEIYENDNVLDFQFNVYSNSIRDFLSFEIENPSVDTLRLLNPATLNGDQFSIELQIDTDNMFPDPTTIITEPDTFITNVTFPDLPADTRYFYRYRTSLPGSSFSPVKSFYNDFNQKYLLIDSLSFTNQNLNKLNWDNDTFKIIPDTVSISVLSAGFYSGATCVIAIDGVNILDNTFFAGMGIAVFDNITLEVDTVTWFQLFSQPANVEALANLIDSIPQGKIVAIGVADDARNNLSSHLIDAIKTLGSSKIDSLEFRGSWALIGRKGAPTGTVIEELKPAIPPQSISIDTAFVLQSTSGFFITNEVGPASKWNEIIIDEVIPGDASTEYVLFGERPNGQIDSLGLVNLENGLADLSDIDAFQYPGLILKGILNVSSGNITPLITEVSVDFKGTPELGTNYQVVSSTSDTILVGEDIGMSFYVYNVGESAADSFTVKVAVISEDNSQNTIFSELVEHLEPENRVSFDIVHNTSFETGNKTFLIQIDSEKEVVELFEDNNFYSVPFFVKADTSTPVLQISFDGTDIIDGDYVSPNPEIKIELTDESLLPIIDSSTISIFLNNEPVYYLNNQSITIEFNEQNPKVVVTFNPELEDGDYTLSVFGKNSLGTFADSSGLERRFIVSSEVKLLNVYNYPNPTSGETYFTFKLTQIPDKIKIRIFTITGRLIKEIEVPSANLNYDFNKVYWDGRDEDGDIVGNGVYIYKVILTAGSETHDVIQKLAIVR